MSMSGEWRLRIIWVVHLAVEPSGRSEAQWQCQLWLWLQWCHSHVILPGRWSMQRRCRFAVLGKFWLATRKLQTLFKRHVEFKATHPVDLLLSGLSRIIHCNVRVVPKRLYFGAFRGWRTKSGFKFNCVSSKIGCWLICKGPTNSDARRWVIDV